jgi:hypothetical protein
LNRPTDVFHLWRKPLALPTTVTGYQVRLCFESSSGNHYQAVVCGTGSGEERLESGYGLYCRLRRRSFASTGAPDWSSIAKVRIEVEVTAGSGTLTVACDNLYWSKGVVQELFQHRRFSATGQPLRDDYAASGGHLYRSDGKRWVSVREGLDPDAVVVSVGSLDRRFLTDGVTSPIKIMPDGAVYRMGIVTPPRQVVLSEISGLLADQKVYVAVKFYSNITFVESAPDDREGLNVIDLSASSKGVRVSNIPVSADPQVTHVRIFLRPELLSDELYFRASASLEGEVANGVTTFDFVLGAAELVNFDIMDPDTDYPSTVAEGASAPVEAFPVFLTEHNGRLLAAFAGQPGVLRFTPFRSPEYWPLENALPLGEGDNDPLTGAASGKNIAFAFKRDAVYPVSDVGGDVGLLAGLSLSHRGSLSHKGIVRVGDDVWFPSEVGVEFIDPALRLHSPTQLARPSWEGFWSAEKVQRLVGVEVRRRFQYLVFGWSTGAQESDRGWSVNYRRPEVQEGVKLPAASPSIVTHGADAAAMFEGAGDLDEVRFARDGVVFRADFGTSRDGRAFTMRHRTGLVGPTKGGVVACFWPMLHVLAAASGDHDLSVSAFVGGTYASPLATPLADLQDLSYPVGSYIVGTNPVGSSPYVHQELRLPPNRGRFLQLELSHSGRADVLVYGLTAFYVPLTPRGGS